MPIGEPTMPTEEPKLTDEERARIAELEKSRALSDAELLKGGAEYVVDENGRKELNITNADSEQRYVNSLNEMRACEDNERRVATLVQAVLDEREKEYNLDPNAIAFGDRFSLKVGIIYLDEDGSRHDVMTNTIGLRIEKNSEGQGYLCSNGFVFGIPVERVVSVYRK
jgi:hypothetical protein